MNEVATETQIDPIALTADLVSAYISNNSLPATELGALLTSVHAAVSSLISGKRAEEPVAEVVERTTSAQIRKSIAPDALISFLDGKPYKTLKRHLSTHGHDFASYRARYGLPADYPTVAPNYSAARSELAKGFGLGTRGRGQSAQEAVADSAEPTLAAAEKPKRGRPSKAQAAE